MLIFPQNIPNNSIQCTCPIVYPLVYPSFIQWFIPRPSPGSVVCLFISSNYHHRLSNDPSYLLGLVSVLFYPLLLPSVHGHAASSGHSFHLLALSSDRYRLSSVHWSCHVILSPTGWSCQSHLAAGSVIMAASVQPVLSSGQWRLSFVQWFCLYHLPADSVIFLLILSSSC